MQVKDAEDDPYMETMPTTSEESELVQMLFDRVTQLRPDWPMGDRSDLAMAMLGTVKKWAHKQGVTNYRGEVELTTKYIRDHATEEVDEIDAGNNPFSATRKEYNDE